ncbi:MAG: hypothetical protein R3D02_09145 [Hyphomicrobiales bacterium]
MISPPRAHDRGQQVFVIKCRHRTGDGDRGIRRPGKRQLGVGDEVGDRPVPAPVRPPSAPALISEPLDLGHVMADIDDRQSKTVVHPLEIRQDLVLVPPGRVPPSSSIRRISGQKAAPGRSRPAAVRRRKARPAPIEQRQPEKAGDVV